MIMPSFCRSVCMSLMLCTVAKRYILQQKRLNKWIGSALTGTRRYNFQPPIRYRPWALNPLQKESFQGSRIGYLSNSWASCVERIEMLPRYCTLIHDSNQFESYSIWFSKNRTVRFDHSLEESVCKVWGTPAQTIVRECNYDEQA